MARLRNPVYGSPRSTRERPVDGTAWRRDEPWRSSAAQAATRVDDADEKGREPVMLLAAFSHCGLP
jgi:hypothetical protein